MVLNGFQEDGKLTDNRMTRGELRALIATTDVYKMSLGRSGRFREEAQEKGVLVFESEARFYEAVTSGDEARIRQIGSLVKADKYLRGEAPDNAIDVWRRSVDTFNALPSRSLVLHWEADHDRLFWGVAIGEPGRVREQVNQFGQKAIVFHRSLEGGWRTTSVGGVPLSNLHPKARDFAINQATLNRVQTDEGYFRALLRDEATADWEASPAWKAKAVEVGWHAKASELILAANHAKALTRQVVEIADHLYAEVERMAATAFHTAAYANGQTIDTVVKEKTIHFATRRELEGEIIDLLRHQDSRCALTGFDFSRPITNPHLLPSLDRKDSARGYEVGNLQVVTRAANFFKSASDDADWALKAKALTSMAVAMQNKRRAATAP